MKNGVKISIATLAILSLCVSSIFAAASNPADTYTEIGAIPGNTAYGTVDPDNLRVNSGGLGSCGVTQTAFLRWDLAGTNGAAGNNAANPTKLRLYVNYALSSNLGQISLYRVTNDDWNEATLTANTAGGPTLGTLIVTNQVANPKVAGVWIEFTGADLAQWINENSVYQDGIVDTWVGDDKVSFALQITGCSNTQNIFVHPVAFDSKDKVGGNAPQLLLFGPNAISIAQFGAETHTTWPFYAGLGALALVAMAGVTISRRRALR